MTLNVRTKGDPVQAAPAPSWCSWDRRCSRARRHLRG